MDNKIAIIAADYPDFISGYSGYNFNLVKELENHFDEVVLVTSSDKKIVNASNVINVKWNFGGIFKIIKILRAKKIKLVNIQYPNLLYGRFNLIPNLLVIILRLLNFRISTTIHEYSNINKIRRIFQVTFLLFSNKIIVTTEHEKKYLLEMHNRLLKNKINVIEIGSNIKGVNKTPNFDAREIIYFGMFYPDKKLLESLKIMNDINKLYPGEFKFKVIGIPHQLFEDYYKECRNYAKSNFENLEWMIGLSDEEIEEQFKKSFCAILKYNDGASLRRGSLLACFVNGVPVLSNKGKSSSELKEYENRGLFYSENLNDLKVVVGRIKTDCEFYSDCFSNLLNQSGKYTFSEVTLNYKNVLSGSSKI